VALTSSRLGGDKVEIIITIGCTNHLRQDNIQQPRETRLRSNINYYTNDNDRRNGYSPNLDAIYDEAHDNGRDTNNKDTNNYYSKSFYERHNMNTPPLISRAERYKQQQQQQ